MSEHTKEPWHVGDMNNNADFIYGVDGWAIANCYLNKGISAKNARRIVACVNACAGVESDRLDKFKLAGALKYFSQIEQQRDEMLVALSAAMDDVPGWYELARAAIEKAEAVS